MEIKLSKVVIAELEMACQISALHYQTINQGFLSSLGEKFLQVLYEYLIQNELVLVYKEDQSVLGYVSCALSSKGIMKRFIYTKPSEIIRIVLAILKKPKLLKPLMETYRAPSLSTSDINTVDQIPETELLSISVSPNVQKGGIGMQLIYALEAELKKRNIHSYKVIAGEKLEGANKFYLKNGFVLAKKISIHGNNISNVYVKEIQ